MKKLWRVVGFSVFLILAASFFQLPKSPVVARIIEYNPNERDSEPSQIFEKISYFVQSNEPTKRKAIVIKSEANAAVAVASVRNLEDQHWLERLEVEVKNISSKPVYYLEIDLSFPYVVGTDIDGVPRRLIMPLIYGRYDLTKEGHLATSDDKPIKPGENYVFTIPESDRSWLESRLAAGTIPESAVRQINIRIYSLSFGDGAGFKAGVPFYFRKL